MIFHPKAIFSSQTPFYFSIILSCYLTLKTKAHFHSFLLLSIAISSSVDEKETNQMNN